MVVTRQEADLIMKIAHRASRLRSDVENEYPVLQAAMDVTAAHQQTPLLLEEMLHGDSINFAHDIYGIRRHMNRRTRRLEHEFVPRFAKFQ